MELCVQEVIGRSQVVFAASFLDQGKILQVGVGVAEQEIKEYQPKEFNRVYLRCGALPIDQFRTFFIAKDGILEIFPV